MSVMMSSNKFLNFESVATHVLAKISIGERRRIWRKKG